MDNNAVSQQTKKWDSIRKNLDPPRDVLHYLDPTPSFISMINQVPHIREEEATGQIQEYLTDEDLEKYPNTIQSGCISEYAADSVDDLIRCYDREFTKARLLQRFTTCHYTNPPDLRVTPQIEKEIEELREEIGDDIWGLTDLDAGLDNVVYLMTSGILYNGNSHPPYDVNCLGYKMSQYQMWLPLFEMGQEYIFVYLGDENMLEKPDQKWCLINDMEESTACWSYSTLGEAIKDTSWWMHDR